MKKSLVFQLVSLAALVVVLAIGCSEDSINEPQVFLETPDVGAGMFGGERSVGDVALAQDNSGGLVDVSEVTIDGPLQSLDYNQLEPEGYITFGNVQAGPKPGTHYESILVSGCEGIAERFVGQDLSTVMVGGYPHDALAGAAAGPLALQSGEPGQNVGVAEGTGCGASEVLVGWGPLGYPDDWAGGEGSAAILFDVDQSEFGIRLCGGNGGLVTLQFFRRDGSLLATATVAGIRDGEYGFRRDGDVMDIAGVSIHNVDVGGVGLDDIAFNVTSTCGGDCVEEVGVRVTPETFNIARYGNWVTGHATLPDGYENEDLMDATIVSIGPLTTSIAGGKLGGGAFKFSSEEFSEVAGLLVAPDDPRMEDVPVCIVFTFSDGNMSCESCWMIDIINESNGPNGNADTRGASSFSQDVDADNR